MHMCLLLFLSISSLCHQTVSNSFRLHSRQNNMTAVSYNYCAGTAAIGRIHKQSLIAGFLNNTFNWCGFRADNRNNTVSSNNITKPNINKLNILMALQFYSIF